jgi:hypothetical protein
MNCNTCKKEKSRYIYKYHCKTTVGEGAKGDKRNMYMLLDSLIKYLLLRSTEHGYLIFITFFFVLSKIIDIEKKRTQKYACLMYSIYKVLLIYLDHNTPEAYSAERTLASEP